MADGGGRTHSSVEGRLRGNGGGRYAIIRHVLTVEDNFLGLFDDVLEPILVFAKSRQEEGHPGSHHTMRCMEDTLDTPELGLRPVRANVFPVLGVQRDILHGEGKDAEAQFLVQLNVDSEPVVEVLRSIFVVEENVV